MGTASAGSGDSASMAVTTRPQRHRNSLMLFDAACTRRSTPNQYTGTVQRESGDDENAGASDTYPACGLTTTFYVNYS